MSRRLFAEFLGTALLLIAVVGSGIAADRLSPGQPGSALLMNAIATGLALAVIIVVVGPVSGAHLNPVVSLVDAAFRGLRASEAAAYVVAQVSGGVAGVVVANLMYSLPAIGIATTRRSGAGLALGEVVATFGLVLVVFAVARSGRSTLAPFAVGAYIAGGYFFTSSTSFANPAVTLARTLSDTFTGIAPASVATFVLAQLVGAALGATVVRLLYPDVAQSASDVIVPHADGGSDQQTTLGRTDASGGA